MDTANLNVYRIFIDRRRILEMLNNIYTAHVSVVVHYTLHRASCSISGTCLIYVSSVEIAPAIKGLISN